MRKIIHLDLDAFFCAVEEIHRPDLVNKPFAVGGKPGERGVVASCSYAARMQGVRSAMPMVRAIKLCPRLIVIAPRHELYANVSDQVMELLHQVTPSIEQISIDEAFLDVSDLSDPIDVIAKKLQSDVHKNIGLPCSLGGATNKLVAKIACDFGKSIRRSSEPPNAITIVPAGQEAIFLAPLPVQSLWGIGPKTANRLAERNILIIGELASLTELQLVEIFGRLGSEMGQRARGIDDRPLLTSHEVKSISQEMTFVRDIHDVEYITRTLSQMAQQVGQRLRASQRCGSTIRLKLRWPNFRLISRQLTLANPTNQDKEIEAAVIKLFTSIYKPGMSVRLVGVGVSNLSPVIRQMSFWDDKNEREQRLLRAIDEIKSRYGRKVLKRGNIIDY